MDSIELTERLTESLRKGLAEIAVSGDQMVILNLQSKYVICKDMLVVYHAKGVRQYPIGRITHVQTV